MLRETVAAFCLAALAFVAHAQETDRVVIKILSPTRPAMAIPDFRGAGDAAQYMDVFNRTLWSELEDSGRLAIVPKSLYPLRPPQRPEDFRPQGPRLADWSEPPVKAIYLAFGYTASQAGQTVVRAWLYDVRQPDLANAQVFGKTYLAPLSEEGARRAARDFAADILGYFGGVSLADSKIYFVSDRTGAKEIWVMDSDGRNQRPITRFNSISIEPAVSPDGTRIAFTSYARGNPQVFLFSVDPARDLRFKNQTASLSSSPAFTPDGQHIVYSSSAGTDRCCRIFIANLDETGFRPITAPGPIDTEPKVNPRTGADLVFVSERSGRFQIYRMNVEGADVERLTPGEGEASNPAWAPDAQHIAFAWTRGYAPGNYNIFVMDVATREYTQLTHQEGKNEHPSWAPGGRHIVFSSTRSGKLQIWSMLADGTRLRQLTTEGNNDRPVWGR